MILFALWAAIKNRLSAQWQAHSLLLIPLLAVAIGAIKSVELVPQTIAYTVVLPAADVIAPQATVWANTVNWTTWYVAIMAVFTLVLAYKVVRNLWFFKGAPVKGRIRIKESDEAESFSFFNNVHIQTPIAPDQRQIILAHELWHVRLRHSWQNVIIEIWQILFWCNPAFFWIKKALKSIHEFQVDGHMYKTHHTAYMHHLLAHAMQTTPQSLGLTSGFVQSLTLKKRLEIMKKPFSNQPWLLVAFPLLVGAAIMVSCEAQKEQTPSMEQEIAEVQQMVIEEKPDAYPEFDGGQQAMYQFMMDNMQYPAKAKEEGLEGRVIVQFTVLANGEVTNAVALNKGKGENPPDESLIKEALRMIDVMPDFTPGTKDGKNVNVQMVLPIVFKLQD
jgi:TonB family protein